MGGGNQRRLRRLATNSSGSVRESRYYLQMAGAEARERLLLAAAEMWKVPASELVAKDSVITHAPSGRRTTYGAIAGRAAQIKLPDPSKIKIKGPDQFTLIGTEQKNRDVPLKVTGKAVYGIDVDLPGMLYAAVKACPVFGGTRQELRLQCHQESSGHPLGRQVRQARATVSGGVAVVADTWWRAKTALDLMPIEWDFGAERQSQQRGDVPGRLRVHEAARHDRARGRRQLRRRQEQGRQGGRGDLHGAVSWPMPAWSRATPPRW